MYLELGGKLLGFEWPQEIVRKNTSSKGAVQSLISHETIASIGRK